MMNILVVSQYYYPEPFRIRALYAKMRFKGKFGE